MGRRRNGAARQGAHRFSSSLRPTQPFLSPNCSESTKRREGVSSPLFRWRFSNSRRRPHPRSRTPPLMGSVQAQEARSSSHHPRRRGVFLKLSLSFVQGKTNLPTDFGAKNGRAARSQILNPRVAWGASVARNFVPFTSRRACQRVFAGCPCPFGLVWCGNHRGVDRRDIGNGTGL